MRRGTGSVRRPAPSARTVKRNVRPSSSELTQVNVPLSAGAADARAGPRLRERDDRRADHRER